MARRYSTITWTEVFAFWGMVIAGFSHVFGAIFNSIVEFTSKISSNSAALLAKTASTLIFLGNIALFIAIVLPAYQFVKYKTKGWRIFYWIAVTLFVIGVLFGYAVTTIF